MITPDFMRAELAKKSKKASATFDCENGLGAILITSKINGIVGNQISISIEFDDLPGPPTCTVNGLDILYRIPNTQSMEASGGFYYNGSVPVNYLNLPAFLGLWYAGDFNGKKAYNLTGDPSKIKFPLTDDGEFFLYYEGAWHLIMRTSGVELMHWSCITDIDNIQILPYPDGWVGVAPLCTGAVQSHYAAPIYEAQYLSLITEGSPILPYLAGNQVALSLLDITVPNGMDTTKVVLPVTLRYLDGGK